MFNSVTRGQCIDCKRKTRIDQNSRCRDCALDHEEAEGHRMAAERMTLWVFGENPNEEKDNR